jgi:hypothetical protein
MFILQGKVDARAMWLQGHTWIASIIAPALIVIVFRIIRLC